MHGSNATASLSKASQELISSHLQKLVGSFGMPTHILDISELKAAHDKGDVERMVYLVREQMNLTRATIRLGKVKSGGPADANAWITLPELMPVYGSPQFCAMKFNIFIRETYIREASFFALCKTISHELAHLKLSSTYHPLKDSEQAVDLTAMLFGFSSFYEIVYSNPEQLLSGADRRNLYLNTLLGLETETRFLDEDRAKDGYLTSAEARYASGLVSFMASTFR